MHVHTGVVSCGVCLNMSQPAAVALLLWCVQVLQKTVDTSIIYYEERNKTLRPKRV